MATTHKMSKTKIYAVWNTMRMRCSKPSQQSYRIYGERGIKVCKRWSTFENFYQDMGESYQEGLVLDRRDNNKGYSPANCRWVTPLVSANNTRRSRRIEINGATQSLSTWIRESEVKPSTIKQRYYVYGWPIERALGMGGYSIGN